MKPFEEQKNFTLFCSRYIEEPIVLYVGAGISKCNNPKYGLPDWRGLLNKLAEKITHTKISDLNSDPWGAADQVLDLIIEKLKRDEPKISNPEIKAEEVLQQALWDLIQSHGNLITHGDKKTYKLINKDFLKDATTLRAISSFCAKPISKSNNGKTYRFGANSRVRAIISGNYDPYLEAATTSMFKTSVAKPVAAYGSKAGNLRKVPVYHVHGYVSHSGQREESSRKPLQKELVLTRNSYSKAWDEKDAFCATMISQIFLLRHYTTLFIGFSFTDPKITELLLTVRGEYKKKKNRRWNYAIMKSDTNTKGHNDMLKHLGIRPIFLENYYEIPECLGSIYTKGMSADNPSGYVDIPFSKGKQLLTIDKKHSISNSEVWEKLFSCHQSHPGVFQGVSINRL